MARMMMLGVWLLIAAGAASGPPITSFVPWVVCVALYALLILSAGVFEWLMGIRNCYTSR